MTDIRDIYQQYIISLSVEDIEKIREYYRDKLKKKPENPQEFWTRLLPLLKDDEKDRRLARVITETTDNKYVKRMFNKLAKEVAVSSKQDESSDSDEDVDSFVTDDEVDDNDDEE